MIIADTSFLSSFFKINRIKLIFLAFNVKEIIIPPAVLKEISSAPFHKEFLEMLETEQISLREVGEIPESNLFGRGELEGIFLAEKYHGVFLTDDRAAGKLAESRGIVVVDIITFLFYCKIKKLLSTKEIKEIIGELKDKDYYQFNENVKEQLLKE